MHLATIGLVFGVIFIAELPDKTLFASLVLGNRFPSLWVWLGAATAFLIHVIIAVSAGHLLTLLPHRLLEGIISVLFLLGALLLFYGKHGVDGVHPHPHAPKGKAAHSFRKVFAMSFTVIFLGEWGDITQIATANYAAKYHDALSVGLGSVLGLWAVTALAIFTGSKALSLIPSKVLQRTAGIIFLGFALFTMFSALS